MTGPPPAVPETGFGPAPVPGRCDRLAPGLRRLTAPNPGMMTGPGTNTYLVGESDVAVVDPGPDDQVHRRRLLAAVAAGAGAVRWVLVTHTHPDHAPGAAALAMATGAECIGFEGRPGFVPDRTVGDGWALEASGFRLEAVHTPGHSGDHLCWLLEGPSILLSGDHVMHGSTVVIRPPDGDMAVYLDSLRRILALDPPVASIAPGHGRQIGEPSRVVQAVIVHRLERERAVAAALTSAGRATVDQLLAAVYADVGDRLRPVARYSLWAHLRKLAAEGRAVSTAGPALPDAPVATGAVEAPDLEAPWEATAITRP